QLAVDAVFVHVKPPPAALRIVPADRLTFTVIALAVSGPLFVTVTVQFSGVAANGVGTLALTLVLRSAAGVMVVVTAEVSLAEFVSIGFDDVTVAVLTRLPVPAAWRTTVTKAGVPTVSAGKLHVKGEVTPLHVP